MFSPGEMLVVVGSTGSYDSKLNVQFGSINDPVNDDDRQEYAFTRVGTLVVFISDVRHPRCFPTDVLVVVPGFGPMWIESKYLKRLP